MPNPPAASVSVLAATVAAAIVLTASVRAQTPDTGAPNTVRLTMRTPHAGFNRMVVQVTVCEPGSDRCAAIDDVMVDTGSTGLRLEASAVPAWLHLPPVLGPDRKALAECLRFVHDVAWGPLHRADVRLGGLTAADLPLQVIADDDRPQPAGCPRSEVRPTSNGTLGIGPHRLDCAGSCEQDPAAPGVFRDEGTTWVPVGGRVAPAFRLPNPVSRLPVHGNGIVIDLPAPPRGGAEEVVGTLTFGVGTAANNGLGSAGVVRVDAAGRFTTLYDGRSYPDSYIDSGTETYILDDGRLARCQGLSWAYCVAPQRQLSAAMIGRDGAQVPVTFTVGDYRAARARREGASIGMAVAAEPASRALVWGAPFFLGRRVFVVLEGESVPGAVGPFYAVR